MLFGSAVDFQASVAWFLSVRPWLVDTDFYFNWQLKSMNLEKDILYEILIYNIAAQHECLKPRTLWFSSA